jgi:hypothetical protein
MKKIKKFKINLRQREIARLLKATTKTEITPQLEEAIRRESARLQPLINPAAVYETQPKEKVAEELSAAAPERWVAASSYVVTIGSEVEGEIRDAQGRSEGMLAQILHAVALEALEQTDNFVHRLLVDEARSESCELSDRQQVATTVAWTPFSAALLPDKIGVSLKDPDRFTPMFSSAGIVYWIPVKKKGAK